MIRFREFVAESTIKQELERNARLVDPALLTLQEYRTLANKSERYHPDNAYDWDLKRMNEFEKNPVEDYPKLINTIKRKGITFEVRAKVEDVYTDPDIKFVKYDANDQQVRINGEIQYYTPEELIALNFKRYRYSFAIIEKDNNKIVAVSQDEWGCILIAVAQEYRGFGLGELISKITRDYQPDKGSGGFTNAGLRTFVKVHREFVRDYLTSGKYNELIKSGQISKERVKEIIASANLSENPPKNKLNFDLNPSEFNIDRSKWLLYSENNEFIIYDSRLKDYWQSDLDPYWIERFFIGMIYSSEGYSTNSKVAYPHSFGGLDNQVKQFLLMLQLTDCKKFGEKLRLNQEQVKLLDPSKVKIEPGKERNQFLVTLVGNGIDFSGMVRKEKQFRKSFDQHDEFQIYVAETAYGIFE